MIRSLFLFRRDLRVADNSGLLAAAALSDQVTACFILDPEIMSRHQTHDFRWTFLLASLADLDRQVTECGGSLRVLQGNPAEAVARLLQSGRYSAVHVNRDYTPYARRRDRQLSRICEQNGVRFEVHADALLNEPEAVLKRDGSPYVIFTPYYRAAVGHRIAPPVYQRPANLAGEDAPGQSWRDAPKPARQTGLLPTAGRAGALETLRHIDRFRDYDKTRDYPALPGTSRLSAHLRFGTCSVREVWHRVASTFGPQHSLVRQLYWRDFFTQVAHHFPRVFGHAFKRQYDRIAWRADQATLVRWQEGRTGFPIVDAAMHELVATGYMHNRVRMVTASFLTKNLHIDWRIGEAFFARYLIDYDPAVNNGNWQWAASTGCDAQPWFRVFNPWRQQVKFDPDGSYIKQWIPALADWPASRIHKLERDPSGYLPPMVDLKRSAEDIKAAFRMAGRADARDKSRGDS